MTGRDPDTVKDMAESDEDLLLTRRRNMCVWFIQDDKADLGQERG